MGDRHARVADCWDLGRQSPQSPPRRTHPTPFFSSPQRRPVWKKKVQDENQVNTAGYSLGGSNFVKVSWTWRLAFEDMALSVRGRGVGGLAVVETYQATTPHARVLHHW